MRLNQLQLALLVLIAFGAASCAHAPSQPTAATKVAARAPVAMLQLPHVSSSIHLTSPAFASGAAIPARYTCHGADVSPPLAWSGVPARCAGLALTCQDPDAPGGTFTHWVLWNLPPQTKQLPEGVPTQSTLANHANQGINGFKAIGYRGACPPSGTHRYVFTLFALDLVPALPAGEATDGDRLLRAMNGHIVASGQLVGTSAAP